MSAEQKYSTTAKEALAVKWAIETTILPVGSALYSAYRPFPSSLATANERYKPRVNVMVPCSPAICFLSAIAASRIMLLMLI